MNGIQPSAYLPFDTERSLLLWKFTTESKIRQNRISFRELWPVENLGFSATNIHSKSEKVCRTAFSVKRKNCGKKCVNMGVIFGPFWVILAHFGSFLGYFGPFWVILGPFWAIWGHIWTILGNFWPFLCHFMAFLDKFA